MEEEQPRLFVQHVAVDGGYVDIVRSQCSDHRVHLIAGEYEIPGDSCLAATGGLKTDGYRHAIGPTGLICMPFSVTGSRRGTAN